MGLFDFLKKNELEEIAQLKSQLERYKPITDIESETKRQREQLEKLISDNESEIKTIENKFIGVLSLDYTKRKTKLDMESINHLQNHAASIGGVLMTYLQQ